MNPRQSLTLISRLAGIPHQVVPKANQMTALLFFLLAAMTIGQTAMSAPIRYELSFTIDEFFPADAFGLDGSTFELIYELDTDPLTPTFDGPAGGADRVTIWPGTNLSIQLTISGSVSGDGVYVALNPEFGSLRFDDNDTNPDVGDSVSLPLATFDFFGSELAVGGVIAKLPMSFNTPPASGTVFPYAFESSDVSRWQSPSVELSGLTTSLALARGTNVSGHAVVVPEPSTLSGGVLGVATIAGCLWCRRRSAPSRNR